MISRRAFLYAVSGSVLVPLAAEAQPAGKVPRLTIPPSLLLRADQVIE